METHGGVDVGARVFLTAALVKGQWSASRPCHATPRGQGPRYPLDRRMGGLQYGLYDLEKCKNLDPTGAVQPVASHYTDCVSVTCYEM
jgi:hypothetical protein